MTDDASFPSDAPTARARRWPALAWTAVALLVLAALAAIGLWQGQRVWRAQAQVQVQRQEQLRADLQAQIERLRGDQRGFVRSLQDQAATQRVLREEVLGLGQRNAALEENLTQLAAAERSTGAQSLRLDEVELLLVLGGQRLDIAGDLAGARRAYALAAGVLDGLDDPRYLDLRQSLAQERAALAQPGAEPRTALAARLQRLAARLPQLPTGIAAAASPASSWWQQMLSPLVTIRPASADAPVAGSERRAAADSLQIELSLARAALERGDAAGWRLALQRVGTWIERLWPATPLRSGVLTELQALEAAPLRADLPLLGSTLQQLRALHDGRSRP